MLVKKKKIKKNWLVLSSAVRNFFNI